MNTISEQTHTERKLVPKGTHPGRCISIVDLGTGPETYKGETKMRRTLNITWELPKQTVEIDGQPMPMRISKKLSIINIFLSPKAITWKNPPERIIDSGIDKTNWSQEKNSSATAQSYELL